MLPATKRKQVLSNLLQGSLCQREAHPLRLVMEIQWGGSPAARVWNPSNSLEKEALLEQHAAAACRQLGAADEHDRGKIGATRRQRGNAGVCQSIAPTKTDRGELWASFGENGDAGVCKVAGSAQVNLGQVWTAACQRYQAHVGDVEAMRGSDGRKRRALLGDGHKILIAVGAIADVERGKREQWSSKRGNHCKQILRSRFVHVNRLQMDALYKNALQRITRQIVF